MRDAAYRIAKSERSPKGAGTCRIKGDRPDPDRPDPDRPDPDRPDPDRPNRRCRIGK
ncbi:hypothetical protein [Thermoleptolyngbya sp. C42_A2020_037]|uniref:hypothetical protein n=1 Tax=Thermoleptolyngbya sp. C42_A2020_037 TaxID=2747799 RepID=UPI001A0AA194|nr:hypothetical protein [Thermoleptolyngbya sp. C42_A2020_037]MBF2083179.1 hypothetical protein [Thermoleptolyngbya sp. C42_A2020_037]